VDQAPGFTDRIMIRRSRRQALVALALCLALVAFFVLIGAASHDPAAFSWRSPLVFLLAFLGLLSLFSLALVIRPDRLILDRTGFASRNLGMTRTYRWSDIEEFFPWSFSRATSLGPASYAFWSSVSRAQLIGFNFKPGRGPKGRLVGSMRKTLGTEAVLRGDWEKMTAEQVIALLNERKARYG
jgi:hypothetical protein